MRYSTELNTWKKDLKDIRTENPVLLFLNTRQLLNMISLMRSHKDRSCIERLRSFTALVFPNCEVSEEAISSVLKNLHDGAKEGDALHAVRNVAMFLNEVRTYVLKQQAENYNDPLTLPVSSI